MTDRATVILRLVGLITLALGFMVGYFALTSSPGLYPPLQASYLIIAAIMGGAGFLAAISKYEA